MRWFGLLGLLLALVVVAVSVRHQLNASRSAVAKPAPVGEPSRQIQQQYKQALDAALQAPRAMPDDAQ